ncbi:hypothetical protein [Effusibacillus dendaii]|uniref:Uncharacterized protein n=1 Tax=Effusibacillus dendaii TaxID=2743772 RepID=A0A7I8D5A8_9BACL|nr:hypothetical protein [Effusibacillus dendaii]BCJ85333.1 hypothetical protein skT53_03180 [Effusibacillus dendaii]
MMSGSENEKNVAKALLQLNTYLEALELPYNVKDVYRLAYKKRLGKYYNDQWIDLLLDDPNRQDILTEPYTVYSIAETLTENGYKPMIYALLRIAHQLEIGYSHAYVIGIAHE